MNQKILAHWRGQINTLVREMADQEVPIDHWIDYWLKEDLPALLEAQGHMKNRFSAILDAAVRFWEERGFAPSATFRGLGAVSQASHDLPDFLERLSAVERFVVELEKLQPHEALVKPAITALHWGIPVVAQGGGSQEDFEGNLDVLAQTLKTVRERSPSAPAALLTSLPYLNDVLALARNPREFASDLKFMEKFILAPGSPFEKLWPPRMALLLLKARQLDSQGINYSVDVELDYSGQLPPLAVRIVPEGPLREEVSPFARLIFLVFDPAAGVPLQHHFGGTVYVVVPAPKEAKTQAELGMDPKQLIGVVDEMVNPQDYWRAVPQMDLFVPLQARDAEELDTAIVRSVKKLFIGEAPVIVPVLLLEDLLPILRDLEVPSAVVAELLDEYTRGSIGLEEAA